MAFLTHIKTPRYLLRESSVIDILKEIPRGEFLEIGYGSGNMLATLSSMGFHGDGFDISEFAKKSAQELLYKKKISNITLLDSIEVDKKYDLIIMLDVVGYLSNPAVEINNLTNKLKKEGHLIISFFNKRTAGASELLTGECLLHTRKDILQIVGNIPHLKLISIVNFGFPLTSALKPVLNAYYLTLNFFKKLEVDNLSRIKKSGLSSQLKFIKFGGLILNKVTIYPFVLLQKKFKDSDLGPGYILFAKKINVK